MVKKSRKNNNKSSKTYIRCSKYTLKVSRRSNKNYKKSKCVGVDSKGKKQRFKKKNKFEKSSNENF